MGSTLVRGTLLGIVLALLLNLLIFFGGNSLGVSFAVTWPTPETVGIGAIVIFTVVMAILAGITLWILTRVTERPSPIFLWIASIIAVLSLIPVFVATRDMGTFSMLGLMHIASALALTFSLIIFYQRCDLC